MNDFETSTLFICCGSWDLQSQVHGRKIFFQRNFYYFISLIPASENSKTSFFHAAKELCQFYVQ